MGAAKQLQWALEKTPLYNHEMALPMYSKFETLEDFNRDWEMIMSIHRKKFNKLQHRILKVIKGYAAAIPGVAHARISIYIDEIEKHLGHRVHRETVRNTLDKAERLGILIKCAGRRFKDGHNSTTANVVVFNTYKEAYAYKVAKEERELEEAKQLLADHYKSAHKMLGIYGEAVQLVSEKDDEKAAKRAAAAKAKEAAKQAAEQKEKERIQKPATFYQQLKNKYKPSSIEEMKIFKELVAIIYKLMGDYKKQFEFNYAQLEQIMLQSLDVLIHKENVRKPGAMLSVIIRNKIARIVTPFKQTPSPNAPEAVVSKEQVPEWFSKRNEERERKAQVQSETEVFDFEAERRRVQAKLESLKK